MPETVYSGAPEGVLHELSLSSPYERLVPVGCDGAIPNRHVKIWSEADRHISIQICLLLKPRCHLEDCATGRGADLHNGMPDSQGNSEVCEGLNTIGSMDICQCACKVNFVGGCAEAAAADCEGMRERPWGIVHSHAETDSHPTKQGKRSAYGAPSCEWKLRHLDRLELRPHRARVLDDSLHAKSSGDAW